MEYYTKEKNGKFFIMEKGYVTKIDRFRNFVKKKVDRTFKDWNLEPLFFLVKEHADQFIKSRKIIDEPTLVKPTW